MPAGTTVHKSFVTSYSGPRSGRGKQRRYGRRVTRKKYKITKGKIRRA